MKTWMWVVLVVIILGAIAYGFYYYTQVTPKSTPQPDVAPEPAQERVAREDSSLEEIINQF